MNWESLVLAVVTGALTYVVSPAITAWLNRRRNLVADEKDLWTQLREVRQEVSDLWEEIRLLREENTSAWEHIEDVWQAIRQEADGGKAIEGRLRSPKPTRPVRSQTEKRGDVKQKS